MLLDLAGAQAAGEQEAAAAEIRTRAPISIGTGLEPVRGSLPPLLLLVMTPPIAPVVVVVGAAVVAGASLVLGGAAVVVGASVVAGDLAGGKATRSGRTRRLVPASASARVGISWINRC